MKTFNEFLNEQQEGSLYVSRNLLNQAEVHSWAMAQGFHTTIPDMHVTIVYSRTSVDWSITKPQTNILTVTYPDKRSVEQLGEAWVMKIYSPELIKRWQEFRSYGASWDHDGYNPHVTISYSKPEKMPIKPFPGILKFGPEIFKKLDLNWKQKIKAKEYR